MEVEKTAEKRLFCKDEIAEQLPIKNDKNNKQVLDDNYLK